MRGSHRIRPLSKPPMRRGTGKVADVALLYLQATYAAGHYFALREITTDCLEATYSAGHLRGRHGQRRMCFQATYSAGHGLWYTGLYSDNIEAAYAAGHHEYLSFV